MKPYIYATRDKLHIINLEKTQEKLKEVLTALEERIREGKTVVLVGTKKQVGAQVKEIGDRQGISYVNVRWLGGTMTNFAEMQKSINRMKKIESFLETPEAEKMIKKERVRMEAELERMHYKYGGLRNLTKKPEVLFIIDPSHEHNAVREGRDQGSELFAIADTNSDPSLVDHVIPANDDGLKSLSLLMGLVEKTIESGRKLFDLKREEETKAAEADKKEAEAEVAQPDPEVLEEIEEKLEEEAVEAEAKTEVARQPKEGELEPKVKEEKKAARKS